jgi:hypothetical protein
VEGPFDLVASGMRSTAFGASWSQRGWRRGWRPVALWGSSGEATRGRATVHGRPSCLLSWDEWTSRVGAADRIPSGWEETLQREPNARVLERAGLAYVGEFSFEVEHQWTLETLGGFVASTSFLNRSALGDHVEEFEADLARRLLAYAPGGVFHQAVPFAYELARRA